MEEGEGEDDDGKPQSQMTAAEIRNQKRKMKRFRYGSPPCSRCTSLD